MSDFILTVKIMVCIFLFVFGFFFGLIIGLTRKVDKAKLEIEAGMQQLLEKQKKTLVYSGANKINIDYRDAQDNQTNRNIVIRYLYDDGGKTYIRAFCLLRNEMRTFRIDNICKMYIDGAEISEPEIYFRDKIKAE